VAVISRHSERHAVILRQPLLQARRHQQHLLTITAKEVLGHHDIVFNPLDATALRNSHRPNGHSSFAQRPLLHK
jgi:hypothetical protein